MTGLYAMSYIKPCNVPSNFPWKLFRGNINYFFSPRILVLNKGKPSIYGEVDCIINDLFNQFLYLLNGWGVGIAEQFKC